MRGVARGRKRCLLGIMAVVAMLAASRAQAQDRFKIHVRNLDGTKFSGVVVEAWEQNDDEGPKPAVSPALRPPDVRRAGNLVSESVKLGSLIEPEGRIGPGGLIRVGNSRVVVGNNLGRAVADKDGYIEVIVKPSRTRRTIVFIANRTGDVATAMIPFLVDATDGNPDDEDDLANEKTHEIYIAVPKLEVPVKSAPQAPSKYTYAPAVPTANPQPGRGVAPLLAQRSPGA